MEVDDCVCDGVGFMVFGIDISGVVGLDFLERFVGVRF